MSVDISARLQASRKDLLDLGLRNNLISFKKTAKNLALVAGDAGAVFDSLYLSSKTLDIGATGQPTRKRAAQAQGARALAEPFKDTNLEDGDERGLADTVDVPLPRVGRPRKADVPQLLTSLDEEMLFRQLLKIASEAQGFIEEQGVNVLYLALGFLHWYEAESSQEVRRAPLVMVPVSLIRSAAQDPFRLSYTGDDLVINASLAAKLKADFNIKLPALDLEAELTAEDLQAYYQSVAQSVRALGRWAVQADELVLGFFSFGKFLMYKDLDPQSWPAEKLPSGHPLIKRLLGDGFGDQRSVYADDVNVDSVCAAGELHLVRDADSSQTQAILEVRDGSNLVIQGPPGTGKSQTITNVIAELVSQNKTVLFVAEKRAALEVVKRRLDECHLGDAVLELHSQRATKKVVLDELQRSLEQGRPLNDAGAQDTEDLNEVQGKLNDYCRVVSTVVGHSGLSFQETLGRYMRTKGAWPALAPLDFAPLAEWTLATFLRRRERLGEMQVHLQAMGTPSRSPHWGSDKTFFTPVEESSASNALQLALRHVAALQVRASELSERLTLGRPVTVLDIDVVVRAARRAAQAPKLQGVALSTQDWQVRRDALRALLEAGRRMSALRQEHGIKLLDAAWEQDLMPVRQALLGYGSKWWRFMSSEFKAATLRLQSLCKTTLPKSSAERLALVDAVLGYQQQDKEYLPLRALGAALFGAQWQGRQSDWPVLERITSWVVTLHDDLGRGSIPAGIVDFLSGHFNSAGLDELADAVDLLIADAQGSLTQVVTVLGLIGTKSAVGLKSIALEELADQLSRWRLGLGELRHMARFNALSEQLQGEGLGQWVDLAADCDHPDELIGSLELTWYSGLVEATYATNPTLQYFDRVQQEYRIARFRELDLASLRHAQTKVASRVWEKKPHLNQPGEMAVLRHEINKKRSHLPIRQLMLKAGHAIQKIKPVFMMSPMSIANFLAPGVLDFDVVIFDEASQVKAVDAFGAILRGKQVVVVGDTRQMPPTDFFGREVENDDEDNSTADIESILTLFKAAGCTERYLRWHYRSRHESLIAVSNAEFYDNKLVIFPAAGTELSATGIHFDYQPEALYDRGRTRTNKGEAQAVAQAVIAHAQRQPLLSLGVAAFSMAQRDLIEVEVELLRRQTPAAEPFFAGHPNEPFFVKNLENIQGDERDAIFISIGYGRNETGKISPSFGPLNREGGHRRLNVLITRAKMVMRVFSNFKGDELPLDANASKGVRALKNFLKYAETRELEVAEETGKAVDSPFEADVIEALRELGYQIEGQVGTAGYFIDMAVRDPAQPGRYLLAIECDGASYHSSRSARDRDRLRQGVLEGLGWTFHRIWSTDWFRNRQFEIERIVKMIEAAQKAIESAVQQPATAPQTAAPHVIARGELTSERETQGTSPYVKVQLDPVRDEEVHVTPARALGAMVMLVVAGEGPIHLAEVTRRVMDAYGVVRAGTRIASSVRAAVDHCVRSRQAVLRDDFVYARGSSAVTPRDRSAFGTADRKIEWVCNEEIDAALHDSVRLGFSLNSDDAVASAVGLLGFGRTTLKIAGVVQIRLANLVKAGRLNQLNNIVTLGAKALR